MPSKEVRDREEVVVVWHEHRSLLLRQDVELTERANRGAAFASSRSKVR